MQKKLEAKEEELEALQKKLKIKDEIHNIRLKDHRNIEWSWSWAKPGLQEHPTVFRFDERQYFCAWLLCQDAAVEHKHFIHLVEDYLQKIEPQKRGELVLDIEYLSYDRKRKWFPTYFITFKAFICFAKYLPGECADKAIQEYSDRLIAGLLAKDS